ncbi:hypothetical protein M427DRAFT_238497 [Gonapodya prolifera JEL478]|uniref:RNI-like protein n=1 Tax=Gonapodya prolifera (strain JEL478) TaxID=1344416 RepID=A0A138ZXW9_GONPJ|nr:hypothetical protein M427DRAFT_238497 [Gonapodya prolifera JEL478]|eukprot:KXS09326.1 hypothetical protein M427DRAFT_238497 [Gonapodya prolifera JEL478]
MSKSGCYVSTVVFHYRTTLWLPHVQQLHEMDTGPNDTLMSSVTGLRYLKHIAIGCVPMGTQGALRTNLSGLTHLETLELTEFSSIVTEDLRWLAEDAEFSLRSLRIGTISSLATPSLQMYLPKLFRHHARTLQSIMIVDEEAYCAGLLPSLAQECPNLKRVALFVKPAPKDELMKFCSTLHGLEAFALQVGRHYVSCASNYMLFCS